jgi:RNA polymerase sigma factor (sigma-70 family)
VARKVKRRDLVELHVVPDLEPAGPFDLSMAVADRDRLERELQRLSIDQRTVLVLHFYVGLPIADVAAVLDIPVGTVKSRLNRGLESMRASMRVEPEAGLHLVRERSA